eukprot:TRINITY_DN15419_c0_g1_i11.p1 TRINITY_DN15419_c0_g1~~TRINITY_DN15419_c0_g1_i11.p1  ORF type:complete len:161 (+),score=37.93 TRINITY_DN15419_c0_g1_i11:616-1098(+)
MYLSMLGKHPHYKTAKPLHAFLTCDKAEEFETYKAKSATEKKESLILAQLKNLQLKDTFNLLYSLVKTKLFTSEEPTDIQTVVNFDSVLSKIDSFIPLLQMLLHSIEGDIKFKREHARAEADLVKSALEERELSNKSEGLVGQYYMNHCMLLDVNVGNER